MVWNLLCKADKSLERSRVKKASARVMSTWEGTVFEQFFQRVTLFRGMMDFQDNVYMRWTMKSRCNETFVSAMFGLGVFWCRENNCWWTTRSGMWTFMCIFSFCILYLMRLSHHCQHPGLQHQVHYWTKNDSQRNQTCFRLNTMAFVIAFFNQSGKKKFVPYELSEFNYSIFISAAPLTCSD